VMDLPKPTGEVIDQESGRVVAQMYDLVGTFLEIGCNSGKELQRASDQIYARLGSGIRVVGVDSNEEAIRRTYYDNSMVMDAQSLAFRNSSMNFVLCRHTLEHVPRVQDALEEIVRISASGAIIALSYPYEIIRGITAVPSAIITF
jgi:ubiquinone/menaquinone biosynthesis C-methylase UbiE